MEKTIINMMGKLYMEKYKTENDGNTIKGLKN